ncbi:MAG TPA: GNAT family N-acetyltransferase, partial [Pyrinomonadaceae bacterium]|nr:GNAT family N-acetyltransferase [Pyrinomonadaceae bacterium]
MYKIRLATPEDAETLVRLRVTFLEEVGQFAEGVDPAAVAEAFRRYLRRKLPAGEFLAWVAEEGGEIVATSGLVFFERPPNGTSPTGLEAYVMNMYTRPPWRGRGLATALLDAAIAHAKRTDARRVWLHA